jgi:hypothetical protein
MNKLISAIYLIVPPLPLLLMLTVPMGSNLDSDFGVSLITATWVIALVFLVLYIIHITQNEELTRQTKPVWILLLLLLGPFSSMVYWNNYIRKSSSIFGKA